MKPSAVTIYEVSPRDGFQSEKMFIPTADKIALIEKLSSSGLKNIEVTSCVSPKLLPQFCDQLTILQTLPKSSAVKYSAFTPNLQGLQMAINTPISSIAFVTAASDSFNLHNTNCTIAESLQRFPEMIRYAKERGINTRMYISCSFGCPYEGEIKPAKVAKIIETLLTMDIDELALADTIGVGTAKQTEQLLKTILPIIGSTKLAMHFHDTYGQAIANILAAIELGVQNFDSAIAGVGGCPYAPGSSGNVATEDVLYLLQGLGIKTGIDLNKIVEIGDWLCKTMHRTNHSKAGIAILAKKKRLS